MGLLDFLMQSGAAPQMPPGMINVRGVPMRPWSPFSGGGQAGPAAPAAPPLPFESGGGLPPGMFPPLPGMDAEPSPEEIAAASGAYRGFPRLDMGRKNAFAGGASPLAAGGMDMAGLLSSLGGSAGGDDESAGSVQPSGETVPLPRARPAAADATDFSGVTRGAPVGEPLSLAPPAPAPGQGAPPAMPGAAPEGGGIMNFLGDNSALLLALAGGFAGAPSIGTGMRRAFSNAAPVQAQREASDRATQTQTQTMDRTYRDLIAAGVPPNQALAAARNPVILKEVADKYLGKDSAAKNPVTQKFNTPDGEVVRQWDAASNSWKDVPGQTPDPGDKRRSLSVTDIEKLSEKSRNMQAIDRYAATFKPEYAGDVSETYGDLKNAAGAKLPGVPETLKERSAWWRDYQEYRNNVRHGLYGSALTKQETENFLRQDITPGMQPDQIRKVLSRQQEIVRSALKREGGALIEAGHKKAAIAKAYGVDPSFFDDEAPAASAPKTRGGKVTVGGGKTLDWSVSD